MNLVHVFHLIRGVAMIRVVTDSTAQLTEEEIARHHIIVVPLQITINNEALLDGIDISRADFSKELQESDVFPHTSQPSIGQFLSTYDELSKKGDTVISIHLSEVLSGTVNEARSAALQTAADVTVIDSGVTDRSLGYLVLRAAEMAEAGKSKEELLAKLAIQKKQTHLFCFVNSLDYLVKGGRASRAIGFFSSLIKLKLELIMENDQLKVLHKCRGQVSFQKLISDMLQSVVAEAKISQVGLSYVDSDEDVQRIAHFLHEHRPDIHVVTRLTSPIIMSHVGPRGFALMYDV
ncbi:DegV domain-containing protein [Oenococcus sicerae]|nr:DegV domain-containing protein [Oenococcus sicerae]